MKNRLQNFVPFALVLATLAFNLSVTQPAQAGAFLEISPMTTTRSAHTATLLPNGAVLLAGGLGTSGFLASAELFDPATGTWKTTGALNLTRDGHTATLLPNGKVLVAGGHVATDVAMGSLASAELFDPATGKWTATGSLITSRRWSTATLLPNGKVLVVGGYNSLNGFLASAELFDPATGTWTETGSLSTPRRSHTATLLADGKVLIAGGLTRIGDLANAEIYDPATGTWMATGAMTTARKYHTATLLPNGKVLVAGGQGMVKNNIGTLSSAELFDPITGTWQSTGALVTARFAQTATLLANGNVLVAGGYNGAYLSSAEVYVPAVGKWMKMGALNHPRALHTATLLSSGQVLLTGGNNDTTRLNLSSAELFDPSR